MEDRAKGIIFNLLAMNGLSEYLHFNNPHNSPVFGLRADQSKDM
jgi:hypothetical protein